MLVQAGHAHWRSWESFPEAVRQGAGQAKDALGADIFDYLSRPENAEEAALFTESMADLANLTVQGAVAGIDTAGVSTAVDVGGADGRFILELMAADPGLRGQVLDLPHAVSRRRRLLRPGTRRRLSAGPRAPGPLLGGLQNLPIGGGLAGSCWIRAGETHGAPEVGRPDHAVLEADQWFPPALSAIRSRPAGGPRPR
ncbi:methyltransferase [Actinoallomurus iriomotensis]|uniref:O-methyltransferase C-terminal domain-containing protein n=1 Tax=Actinoallomurus iriomotensis TaxID=478107 RepID=A0A9W6RXT1_9ACTN|nr:hypothetical protein Airi02_017080 [Actinoallomurus iriomotensis]